MVDANEKIQYSRWISLVSGATPGLNETVITGCVAKPNQHICASWWRFPVHFKSVQEAAHTVAQRRK